MAMNPETKFKIEIYPDLKKLPKTWVKKIQLVGLNGIPDFLMCVNSHFVALELKVEEDLKELQNWNLKLIGECGGIGLVVTPENWETTHKFLKTLANQGLKAANQLIH